MKKKKKTPLLFPRNGNYSNTLVKKAGLVLLSATVFLSACKKIPEEQSESSAPGIKTAAASTSATGPDFTIAVLPDTQNYVMTGHNTGSEHWLDYFTAQTQWIVDNRTTENIAYVIHLGDVSEDGDGYITPWYRIDTAMRKLDSIGIPYGVAVGNHDQGFRLAGDYFKLSSPTLKYNQYFGIAKFTGKSWYQGHYNGVLGTNGGDNNDNHYDFFSAGGINFIVVYLEFDQDLEENTSVNQWAYDIIQQNNTRKAIIVTHYLTNPDDHASAPNQFGVQAAAIHAKLKSLPNVFMMLGGHVNGEGYRQETYSGRTIKSFTSDFQFKALGGEGYMRLMKISTINDQISVKTYSPYRQDHGQSPFYQTDANSQFIKPLFHEPTTTRTCDFDNNGKSQLSFFNNGIWKVSGMADVTYGISGDIPAPADYTGDGKTDIAVFRPSEGKWYSVSSANFVFGTSTDIPVPGDYNGDGIAEFARFTTTGANVGKWFVKGVNETGTTYGTTNDIPVPGDYNGDGKTDYAVFRRGTSPDTHGYWYIRNIVTARQYGEKTYVPVPGDYNGDGTTDIVVYNPATGIWHMNTTDTEISNLTVTTLMSGDIPAPGDYFGDGKTHPAIYRPSTNTLYLYNNGVVTQTTLAGGSKLLNLPYHIRKFYFP